MAYLASLVYELSRRSIFLVPSTAFSTKSWKKITFVTKIAQNGGKSNFQLLYILNGQTNFVSFDILNVRSFKNRVDVLYKGGSTESTQSC